MRARYREYINSKGCFACILSRIVKEKMMTAEEILKRYFGYEMFRGFQKEVIDTVMQGRDALVLMPTGGGKSICYQVPALLMDGVTVVISPLIALMKDQVDMLRDVGICAAALNSTLTAEEARTVYRDLESGKIKLLYIAPERLLLSLIHI
mgnify:FL=1